MIYNTDMTNLALSDLEREAIAEALDDPSVDDRARRKLMAVRMHDLGVPHGKIAQTLNVSDDTVTNYTLRHQVFGLFARNKWD